MMSGQCKCQVSMTSYYDITFSVIIEANFIVICLIVNHVHTSNIIARLTDY